MLLVLIAGCAPTIGTPPYKGGQDLSAALATCEFVGTPATGDEGMAAAISRDLRAQLNASIRQANLRHHCLRGTGGGHKRERAVKNTSRDAGHRGGAISGQVRRGVVRGVAGVQRSHESTSAPLVMAIRRACMTINQFLDALTAARGRGYQPYLVTEAYGQTIRLKSPAGAEHCPITAVYECATGQTYPPVAVYSTLEDLGLDPEDAYTIVTAADGQIDEPIIRQQLLAALALPD
jgi:hypothetical protein